MHFIFYRIDSKLGQQQQQQFKENIRATGTNKIMDEKIWRS